MIYRFRGWIARSWRWPTTPARRAVKKLKGYVNQWRIRVGDWHVVYAIDDDRKVVSITRVAHRREVYEP